MKVLSWMNTRSPHQAAFFQALRNDPKIDLEVRYYGSMSRKRKLIGWTEDSCLPVGEMVVPASLEALESVPRWREYIHTIPGRGHPFLRTLVAKLIEQKVAWVNWSELRQPGYRRVLGFPFWAFHGHLVAKYALGAFACDKKGIEDFVRLGIPREKLSLLYYAIAPLDKTVLPNTDIVNFAKGRRLFLYCGSLYKGKAIDVLLKSFAKLQTKDWVLVLTGMDESRGKYQRQSKKLGISNSVYFQGPVPMEKIATVMKAADVLVLPSRYDGWGVVLNEAASIGMPLIGSVGAGASQHLIEPAVNGFHVKTGDVYSLSNAMSAYVKNPKLVEFHGQESLRVFKHFTPEQNVQRFVAAIRTWQSMG